MPNSSQYIKHNSGIWGMFQFLDSYLKYGYKYDIQNKIIIELSSFYSQHIGIGSTNNKKLGKNYFLLFSQQLFNSLNLIQFDKVIIDKNSSRIYLLSKTVLGDNQNWPTIPPFILSFYLEHPHSFNFLEYEKKLDIKPYYFNENDDLIVDNKTSFSLNLNFLPENENIYSLIPNKIDDYYSLMTKNINNVIKQYSSYVPDFKGTYTESDLHKELRKKGVFYEDNNKK